MIGEYMMANTYLTLQEVADMLKTCTKTVSRLVQRGALPKPVVLSARCLRFERGEVLAYLDKAKGAA